MTEQKKTFRKGQWVKGIEGSIADGFLGKVVETRFVSQRRNPEEVLEWVVATKEGDPEFRKHGYVVDVLEKAGK